MRLPNEDRYLLPIIAAIMMAGGAGLTAQTEPEAVDAAINDQNGLDPAQMNDAAWAKAAKARDIETASELMSTFDTT
jgi:hypothetical protein